MFWNADIIDFCSLSAYVATASPGSSSASEDAVTTYGYLATSGLGIVDADTSFAHSILVYNATAGNKEDVNSPIYPDAAHNFTNCGPLIPTQILTRYIPVSSSTSLRDLSRASWCNITLGKSNIGRTVGSRRTRIL